MGRGSKVGFKQSTRRRVQPKERGSDESDEEYKVGEDDEFDESDEYCSLDEDETEDLLADFGEDEEDYEEKKKVKRVVRSNAARKGVEQRKASRSKKSQKNRRVSKKVEEYDEEEEEEDYEDEDEGDDDEEFMPDESSLQRMANRIKKPWKKRRASQKVREDDEEDEEDEDDEEFIPDESFLQRNGNQIKKPQKRRRVLHRVEEDDEDEEEEEEEEEEEAEDDEEFVPDVSFPQREANQIKKPQEWRISKKVEEDEADYEDEYEDDNEDDEEFMLNSDFVDDEDEMLVMEKNKKVNRPPLKKKGFFKGQKRRRSMVLRKPSRQKLRTNRRLTKKTRCVENGEATNTNRVVDENSRKISVRRTRRQMVESDSDFVNSAPSDFEYTISEEEREQVREASKFCTNLETNFRSSASRKRLQEDEESMCQQRRRTQRKGKEKVEERKNEVVKQVCGICLSEEGKKTVRGSLNCCSHYFCFACIMEWSKVESRCPLCKQRFMTISKPAKSNTGFDLRTMLVQVPERDQIYQPSEEELQGYLDPYENVICTECQQGGDDALMLLCDICDSPAHTFCVGLGREVPEGNWYCEGCRPAAFASLNPQGLSPMGDRRASNMSGPVSPFPGGIDLNALYVPESPLTQETGVFPSFRRPSADHLVASPASGSGAYTVADRRILQHRIRNIRTGQSNFGSDERAHSSIMLFGLQLHQGRASTPQRTIIQESAAPLYTTNGRRLEENTSPLGHNRDLFSARAGQFRGQIQDRTSMSVAGSFQTEHGGFGVAFTPRLVHEQLHPSTSRSSNGADATTSSYACREAFVPSRTSQGGLHTPF